MGKSRCLLAPEASKPANPFVVTARPVLYDGNLGDLH